MDIPYGREGSGARRPRLEERVRVVTRGAVERRTDPAEVEVRVWSAEDERARQYFGFSLRVCEESNVGLADEAHCAQRRPSLAPVEVALVAADADARVEGCGSVVVRHPEVRPLDDAEVRALPLLARGAAMRFLLTRLYDWLNTPPGAMVTPKNPLEYLAKLRFHERVQSAGEYGLDVD